MRWASSARPLNAPVAGRAGIVLRHLWLATLGLFSATLAAEVVLMPIAAAVFARVSVAGLVLNFAAIPAMAVVQIGGMVTAALAGWWGGGAAVAGAITPAAAVLLVSSAGAVDVAPWLSWRVPPTAIGWTAAFYAALGGVLWFRGRERPRVLSAVATGVCLVVIVTAPGLESARPSFGHLRVTMIDVGQGDALLVQFPTGHSLMVDTGGAGKFDIGGRVVAPAAWALGVRRLDWLAITHADLDHIGGALTIARDLRPREIWEGIPVPPNAELRALRAGADAQGIVWRQLSEGHTMQVGSVLVDVLNPPAPDWERQRVRNDDSLVLRLQFGDVEFLLTGDAGREFEDRPEAGEPRRPLRILKVGHHGSLSSSSWPFVRALDPQVALVSAGRGNLFGHPAPDVLARYDRIGATVFRTDRDGAVIVETDGRDVDVRTISGRRWSVKSERR
jgi:competence protein ComEC